MASTIAAERGGFEKVSGPPGDDERMARVAIAPSAAGCPRPASMRTSPAISSSYATLNASTGSSSIGRIDSYVTGGSGGARRVRLALVVEERALAGEPRRLHERAVDALVAERAHPDAVRRRVAERDRERRLLGDPSGLVGDASPDALAEQGCGQLGATHDGFSAVTQGAAGNKGRRRRVPFSDGRLVRDAARAPAPRLGVARRGRRGDRCARPRGTAAILLFAAVVAAGAASLGRRSVLAQVLGRGIAWVVLTPMLLGTAESLWRGHLPDTRTAFFLATSAGALLLARPSLHTAEAKASFSPVAYRRLFLAGSVAATTAGSVAGLFAVEALRWGEVGAGLPLIALAAALLASAVGVVRMRAWGVLLAIVTSAATLAVGVLSGNEFVAFGLALAAIPGALLASPLLAARLAQHRSSGNARSELRARVPDDATPVVRTRVEVPALADEALQPAQLVVGEK